MSFLRTDAKEVIYKSIDLLGYPKRSRQCLKGQLIVLTYHSFCQKIKKGLFLSLPIGMFEKQLQFLKHHFNVVLLEEGVNRIYRQTNTDANKPLLAITIDDGFEDNYNLVFPILKKYSLPATIFLATDFIDNRRPPWPTQISEIIETTNREIIEFPIRLPIKTLLQKAYAASKIKNKWASLSPEVRFKYIDELRQHLCVKDDTNHPPLNWTQVREMEHEGIMFGSHTVYHSILPAVDASVLNIEIIDSKNRIESEIQKPCELFAYPDGRTDEKTQDVVQSLGFKVAVSQMPGANNITTNLFRLYRIEVPFNEGLATFRCRSSLSVVVAR